MPSDLLVIGGGIVGLATAWRFAERFPGRTVTILEKEAEVASHQTGHNSGVLHSGIYYKPGSLKAANCRDGKLAMQAFCAAHNVPFDVCGKVIVAVEERELPLLDRIFERGQANGVRCEMIGLERLAELEPHATGIRAIHVPEAGIVDFRLAGKKLAELIVEGGGQIVTSARAIRIEPREEEVAVETTRGAFAARQVVNCAGLYCDRVARLAGSRLPAKIVPFRGEFYALKPSAHHLVRNLIYPVPDPNFPFLGVHFTRVIDGTFECGPNAVLAFAREGYKKSNINLYDLGEALTYPGFLRLAVRHWKAGLEEIWRSISKAAFVRALQRLVPEIRGEDLDAAPAGVRAQAVARNGQLVDDFLIEESDRVVHVGNAPSPAATSSLNIGTLIVDRFAERFK
jgi:L-2-hydroxyglutarate oxidase